MGARVFSVFLFPKRSFLSPKRGFSKRSGGNGLSLGAGGRGGSGASRRIGSSGNRSISLMNAPRSGDVSDEPAGQLGKAQVFRVDVNAFARELVDIADFGQEYLDVSNEGRSENFALPLDGLDPVR